MKFIKIDNQAWFDFEDICELRVAKCEKCEKWHVIALDAQKTARFCIKDFGKNERQAAEKFLADVAKHLNQYQVVEDAIAELTAKYTAEETNHDRRPMEKNPA